MPDTPPPALRVEGLAHAYGDTVALNDVSVDVARGERLALLGVNGSGKTTLLRAVTTLLTPDQGRIEVNGRDAATDPTGVRQSLGVVFQSPALDDALTVRESLALQAALVGLPRAAARAAIDETMATLGLADRAGDRIGTLSGGLIRRVDLGRGLLHHPPLALLDEPTTGLDPLARAGFWDLLDRLRETSGAAQVVATHLMDEAERCDRVAILVRGRLVALDTPAALTSKLGADALWLDTDDAPALAESLRRSDGLDAQPVGGRVLVRSARPADLVGPLYARPDVSGASVKAPTMDDVFRVASTT